MRKSRLQEVSMEVSVGAFLFLMLLALGVMTILLSKENVFRTRARIQVHFTDVMGLRSGENVIMRGMAVGRVRGLQITPEGVLVAAVINQPLNLRENYRVEIGSISVLGGRVMTLFEGTSDHPPLPEGTILNGLPPVDLLAEATLAVQEVRRTLVDEGVLERLKNAVSHIEAVTERLNTGEGSLAQLLNDDTLHQDLAQLTSDLSAISTRLRSGEGTLGTLLSEDAEMARDLGATMASLRRMAEGLEQGEGSLGKLLQDDALYGEIQRLLHEVRAAVDDFRETAPITTFSSILFGAF